MSIKELTSRLEALEQKVAELQRRFPPPDLGDPKKQYPWWRDSAGIFKDDPDFDAAMKLGRKYRDSDKPVKKRKKKTP